MSRICVFCGSSPGARAAYADAAAEMGRLLAAEGVRAVLAGERPPNLVSPG